MADEVTPNAPGEGAVATAADAGFAAWLSGSGGSLALTTYQAGKVALVGWDGRRITLLLRQFDKPLGLAVHGPNLALATRHDVVLLADAPLLAPGYLEHEPGRYDALYLPRASYHTGDVNAHDLAYCDDGLWLVNTRFSCLARLSADHSFVPAWRPPFVSDVVPEDRCHLNGLAVADGRPHYATCLGETDTVGGWRENKAAGGVLVDVRANHVIKRGLSMPHSPRWHGGQLWVLNSGTGELWVVNPADGRHLVVCALPGYLRGLAFVGRHALVGMCQIRERHIFGDLPIQRRHPELSCGVAIVDLTSGRVEGTMRFTGGVQELYDVQFLPGVRRPMILSPGREDARQAFAAPRFSYWLRPSSRLP